MQDFIKLVLKVTQLKAMHRLIRLFMESLKMFARFYSPKPLKCYVCLFMIQ